MGHGFHKESDMGQGYFLDFTWDMGIDKRQGHMRHWHFKKPTGNMETLLLRAPLIVLQVPFVLRSCTHTL